MEDGGEGEEGEEGEGKGEVEEEAGMARVGGRLLE